MENRFSVLIVIGASCLGVEALSANSLGNRSGGFRGNENRDDDLGAASVQARMSRHHREISHCPRRQRLARARTVRG